MDQIDVVVVVDAQGALSSGSLQDNVYLVDTNHYLGSWQEGQSTLNTVCQDGQTVTWYSASVNPGDDVSITGFDGAAVESKICVPKQDPLADPAAWSGLIESGQQFNSFGYSLALTLGSKTMTLDAFLKVV